MILSAPSYSLSLVISILLSLTLLFSFLNNFILALLTRCVKTLIPLFKLPRFSFDALSYWSCSYLLSAPTYIFITRPELLRPTCGTLLHFLFISKCTLRSAPTYVYLWSCYYLLCLFHHSMTASLIILYNYTLVTPHSLF